MNQFIGSEFKNWISAKNMVTCFHTTTGLNIFVLEEILLIRERKTDVIDVFICPFIAGIK